MPARSLWSSVKTARLLPVAVGALTYLTWFGGDTRTFFQPGSFAVETACAEEAVESASPASRAGVEPQVKLRASGAATREAVSHPQAKAKDKAAKDKAQKEADAADPTLPLFAELRGKAETAAQSDEKSIAAIKKLGELGTPRSVEVLLSELSIGLPPRVAKAALEALAARKVEGGPNAFPVLALYAHHREPELRKQALLAIGTNLPPQNGPPSSHPAGSAPDQAVPLFIAALSDASADVRAVAAKALGARRETRAEPHLIKLLQRKDPAATVALGQIGGPDTARALAEMIGNVPDHMILETLGHLLARSDFGPEPVRLQVVKTIGKMPGSQTLDILGDYVKDTAKDKQRPSRIEAQKIIEQRTAK